MPQFQTLEQAFEWFLENVYPNLPTEQKMPIRGAKYAFYKEGKKVSEKRMRRILDENSNYKNIHEVDSAKTK